MILVEVDFVIIEAWEVVPMMSIIMSPVLARSGLIKSLLSSSGSSSSLSIEGDCVDGLTVDFDDDISTSFDAVGRLLLGVTLCSCMMKDESFVTVDAVFSDIVGALFSEFTSWSCMMNDESFVTGVFSEFVIIGNI